MPRLAAAAQAEQPWYVEVAADLLRPGDQLAVDVGCGAGGMTRALATAMSSGLVVGVDAEPGVLAAARDHLSDLSTAVRVELVELDLAGGFAPLRDALSGPADLIWASASLHHLGDQQAAVTDLAALLAPGGRLALAEGGLPPRHLPWDLGVGAPGLEVRLDAAQDRWFARMREQLPDSVRMPYGWPEALRRAGLVDTRTRSWLHETPAPLADDSLRRLVDGLVHRVDRLHSTDLVDDDDLAAWDRLLDPDGSDWLGGRTDLFRLDVRSVHVGSRAQPW